MGIPTSIESMRCHTLPTVERPIGYRYTDRGTLSIGDTATTAAIGTSRTAVSSPADTPSLPPKRGSIPSTSSSGKGPLRKRVQTTFKQMVLGVASSVQPIASSSSGTGSQTIPRKRTTWTKRTTHESCGLCPNHPQVLVNDYKKHVLALHRGIATGEITTCGWRFEDGTVCGEQPEDLMKHTCDHLRLRRFCICPGTFCTKFCREDSWPRHLYNRECTVCPLCLFDFDTIEDRNNHILSCVEKIPIVLPNRPWRGKSLAELRERKAQFADEATDEVKASITDNLDDLLCTLVNKRRRFMGVVKAGCKLVYRWGVGIVEIQV
jgi:hypothetical protein